MSLFFCYFLSLCVGMSDDLHVVQADLLIQLIIELYPHVIGHGWRLWRTQQPDDDYQLDCTSVYELVWTDSILLYLNLISLGCVDVSVEAALLNV